ncbi:Hypothetical protein A7982_09487 [Minicystis rosea]|nr:Hypothetical protein A7982_09487 [Minicystis rosea]
MNIVIAGRSSCTSAQLVRARGAADHDAGALSHITGKNARSSFS